MGTASVSSTDPQATQPPASRLTGRPVYDAGEFTAAGGGPVPAPNPWLAPSDINLAAAEVKLAGGGPKIFSDALEQTATARLHGHGLPHPSAC